MNSSGKGKLASRPTDPSTVPPCVTAIGLVLGAFSQGNAGLCTNGTLGTIKGTKLGFGQLKKLKSVLGLHTVTIQYSIDGPIVWLLCLYHCSSLQLSRRTVDRMDNTCPMPSKVRPSTGLDGIGQEYPRKLYFFFIST